MKQILGAVLLILYLGGALWAAEGTTPKLEPLDLSVSAAPSGKPSKAVKPGKAGKRRTPRGMALEVSQNSSG